MARRRRKPGLGDAERAECRGWIGELMSIHARDRTKSAELRENETE